MSARQQEDRARDAPGPGGRKEGEEDVFGGKCPDTRVKGGGWAEGEGGEGLPLLIRRSAREISPRKLAARKRRTERGVGENLPPCCVRLAAARTRDDSGGLGGVGMRRKPTGPRGRSGTTLHASFTGARHSALSATVEKGRVFSVIDYGHYHAPPLALCARIFRRVLSLCSRQLSLRRHSAWADLHELTSCGKCKVRFVVQTRVCVCVR